MHRASGSRWRWPAVALVAVIAACREPAAAPGVLADVTADAGLPSRAEDWPDGTYFLPEIMGPGLALFDYDGDGDLDLLQLRVPQPGSPEAPSPKCLFRQDAGLRFTDVTAEAGIGDPGFGQGVAVADSDNDGDLDVYFANFGRNALYRNESDGTFTDVTADSGIADDAWSAAATFCDYDRDGWLDLYVAHYLRLDYRGPCRSASGAPDYCGPATFDGLPGRLWRNGGDGSFTDVTREAGLVPADGGKRAKGLGVVCLDLTDDGWPDFFVANDGEANHLWVNGGDGTFTEQGVARGVAVNRHGRAEANMGIAVGDVDGDLALDLFVTHLTLENNTLYRREGRLFMDRTLESGMAEADLPYTGFGCAFVDLDHDADLDLAVVNGKVRGVVMEEAAPADSFWGRYAEPNLLFENDGKGRFHDAAARAPAFAGPVAVGRGLAYGDLDGDGDLDLVSSRADNTLRVYENRAPAAGTHWLLVRALAGPRDAIGAFVRVVVAGRSFVAPVLPGSSYQSSNDPRVHFGLGGAGSIERIEVLWPDGDRETFPGGAADREVVIRQGSGQAAPS